MTRSAFIERVRRLIYGGQPPDDASITKGMVNNLLPDALAEAAKANMFENLKVEGCRCINNSYYTTFSGIAITPDAEFAMYNITLPEIPFALGRNEGVAAAQVVDERGIVSNSLIFLTVNQINYFEELQIPNGIIAWTEGGNIKVKCSDIALNNYTAKVRMVSGGASTDMDSQLNVPPDALNVMTAYLMKVLGFAQSVQKDTVNDGVDIK